MSERVGYRLRSFPASLKSWKNDTTLEVQYFDHRTIHRLAITCSNSDSSATAELPFASGSDMRRLHVEIHALIFSIHEFGDREVRAVSFANLRSL